MRSSKSEPRPQTSPFACSRRRRRRRRAWRMGDEAAAPIPSHRIKLFTTVSACTLATAFLAIFALGSIYHPGPPVAAPVPVVAPVDSAAMPITSTRRVGMQRRPRRREGAPVWAGDPKKLLKKAKGGGGKKEPYEKRKNVLKHRTEMAGLPRKPLEGHATT